MALELNSDLELIKAWSLGAVGGSEATRKARSVVLDLSNNGISPEIVTKFTMFVGLLTNQAPEVKRSKSGQVLRVSFPQGEKTVEQFGEIILSPYFLYRLICRIPEGSSIYQWSFLSGYLSTSRSLNTVRGRFELRSGSADLGKLLNSVGIQAQPVTTQHYDRQVTRGWVIDSSVTSEVLRQCQNTDTQIDHAYKRLCGRSQSYINGFGRHSGTLLPRGMTSIYHLRDGARSNKGRPLPILPEVPLPSFGSPIPRRRRSIVCDNLIIDGDQWDIKEDWLKMKDALKNDKADLHCLVRPGIKLASGYAMDVCLSSWCRNCPFLPSR